MQPTEAEKLARMAKQMADFFRVYPEDQARAGIRDHIEAFWTPSMRSVFDGAVRAGGTGIDPLVLSAMRHEPEAESPILKEVQGPDELGQLASDAG